MPTRKSNSNLEKNQRANRDASPTLKRRSHKTKPSASAETEPQISDNLISENVALAALGASADSPPSEQECLVSRLEVENLDTNLQSTNFQPITQPLDWLTHFQHHSQLLMAVVEPGTFTLRYANDYFCHLMGIAETIVKFGCQIYCQT